MGCSLGHLLLFYGDFLEMFFSGRPRLEKKTSSLKLWKIFFEQAQTLKILFGARVRLFVEVRPMVLVSLGVRGLLVLLGFGACPDFEKFLKG